MSEPIKNITPEEFLLSMVKHNSWVQLQQYIEWYVQKYDYCEFADKWTNEFFELNNINDIEHFMKDFPPKRKKN